jgi:hypothetical protein
MTTQQQYFTDITLPKKHKVLLLVEPQLPGTDDDCMHLVRIPNSGYLVCCNASTEDECIVCGRPTCPAHFSARTLYVQGREGNRLVSPLSTVCTTSTRGARDRPSTPLEYEWLERQKPAWKD